MAVLLTKRISVNVRKLACYNQTALYCSMHYLKFIFLKKNSTRTTLQFQLYYNVHACYKVTRMRRGNMYFVWSPKKKYLQHFLYSCKNITFMSFADVIKSRSCLEDTVRICESKIPGIQIHPPVFLFLVFQIDTSHCFASDISVFFRTLLNLEQFSHALATYGIFRYATTAGNKIRLVDSCESRLSFASVLL